MGPLTIGRLQEELRNARGAEACALRRAEAAEAQAALLLDQLLDWQRGVPRTDQVRLRQAATATRLDSYDDTAPPTLAELVDALIHYHHHFAARAADREKALKERDRLVGLVRQAQETLAQVGAPAPQGAQLTRLLQERDRQEQRADRLSQELGRVAHPRGLRARWGSLARAFLP